MYEPKIINIERLKTGVTIKIYVEDGLLNTLEEREQQLMIDLQEFINNRLFSLGDY